MSDKLQPLQDEPGFGRAADLEDARETDRPAEVELEADPQAAARDPVTVSPDPEEEDRD